METRIIKEAISRSDVGVMAERQFGDMIKAVVDIERGIIALGGELHADAEAFLLEQGSRQQDVWGINLYPWHSGEEWIECNSMINIKPHQGNRSRGVESAEIQRRIKTIVRQLIL